MQDGGADCERAIRAGVALNSHEPWTAAEMAIATRYARAVVDGRYPTLIAAAVRCHSELAPRRTAMAVRNAIYERVREMGWRRRGPWSEAERAVAERFARGIVQGDYRNVKEAVPECQRELRQLKPAVSRTDLAVAWAVLCRAYDLGLPRRKHCWTKQEMRLLKRHASALAHGRYPDIRTAVNAYKTACLAAMVTVRQKDGSIRARISALARALGYVSSKANLSPEEQRIISGFSRSLAEGKFFWGRAAVPECVETLARAGFKWNRSEDRLADLINRGARKCGWHAFEPLSKRDIEMVKRYAGALAAGRYRTLKAASQACLESIQNAGRSKYLRERGIRVRLSKCFRYVYGRNWVPAWSPAELRILDRYARAYLRGRYQIAAAAARDCGLALRHLDATERRSRSGISNKLEERIQRIRATS